jgi:hypothetical protein
MTAAAPDRAALSPSRLVSPDDLQQWLATAAPGEAFTYFIGAMLVPGMAIVVAARAASERGEVILTQRRREDRLFDYLATKRRNAERSLGGESLCGDPRQANRGSRANQPLSRSGVDCSGSRAFGRGVADADEEKEWLMAVLRRLASFGKPCPTNRELAAIAQLKDAESVRYRLGLLAAEGRIKIHTPPQGPRVVTIVASGRSTARG